MVPLRTFLIFILGLFLGSIGFIPSSVIYRLSLQDATLPAQNTPVLTRNLPLTSQNDFSEVPYSTRHSQDAALPSRETQSASVLTEQQPLNPDAAAKIAPSCPYPPGYMHNDPFRRKRFAMRPDNILIPGDPNKFVGRIGPPVSPGLTKGAAWTQNNWEPWFRCSAEERLGIHGEGGKHICDPSCLLVPGKCIIYSIGSRNEFDFEEMILPYGCEIHTFDHTVPYPNPPKGVVFHKYGITHANGPRNPRLKTLKEILSELNHLGKVINIFKIDIEGGEYDLFAEPETMTYLAKHVQQVLLEYHFCAEDITYRDEAQHNTLAKAFTDAGFYVFSKEPNVIYSPGSCVEMGLLNTQNKELFE